MQGSTGLAFALALFGAAPLAAQTDEPPMIAAVDVYGRVALPDSMVRRLSGLLPGSPAPDSAAAAAAERRLEALSIIGRAEVAAVCCDGGVLVYLGVQAPGAAAVEFRDPPRGDARLPAEVAGAVREFEDALRAAVAAGETGETDSLGHALMNYPAARRIQEGFVPLAAEHGPALRHVLRQSSDPAARAAAAQVLAYSADKAAIVDDLAFAMSDPDPVVRNDATRALALIAGHAERHPSLGIRVPAEPFLTLLRSPVWTDRNKAAFALVQLTTPRDPALLGAIDRDARAELEQMARWHSMGHALPALVILGRVRGMTDDQIFAALSSGKRDAILSP